MSLPAHELDCPSCGQRITYTPPRTSPVERLAAPFEPRPRKGGRQIPLGPAVRALTAFLVQTGYWREVQAETIAKRVCLNALPVKQQRPRKVS